MTLLGILVAYLGDKFKWLNDDQQVRVIQTALLADIIIGAYLDSRSDI